jgi:hypothetical protein
VVVHCEQNQELSSSTMVLKVIKAGKLSTLHLDPIYDMMDIVLEGPMA